MSESPNIKQTFWSRHWKWLTAMLVVIVVLIGVRFSLKSDWALELVRTQAEQIGSDLVYGEVRIDNISGDLWQSIVVQGISVTDSLGNRAVYIDTLKARYSVLSYFGSKFEVNEISLIGTDISVVQWENGRWNPGALLPPDTTETETFPVSIEQLNVTDSRMRVKSGVLPDSSLEITGINVRSAFEISETGMSVSLRQFDMSIREGRLEGGIGVSAQADYRNGDITLDKLTVFTARTLIELVASFADASGAVDATAAFTPLSWRDVAAYTPDEYLLEDLELRIGLGGTLESLNVDLGVSAAGLERLDIHSTLSLGETPELRSIDVALVGADLPRVTGQESMPRIDNLTVTASGNLPFSAPEAGAFEASIDMSGLDLSPYRLDRAQLSASAESGRLRAVATLGLGSQRVRVDAELMDFAATAPQWQAQISTNGVNPALWAADPSLEGFVQGVVSATGKGYEPGSNPWEVTARLTDSRFGELPISEVDSKVILSQSAMDLAGFVQFDESRITATASIQNWNSELPEYTGELRTIGLNVSEFTDIPDFVTSLNMMVSADGSGFDPKSMQLKGTMYMSESSINGASVDSLTARLDYRDGVINLQESTLESTLATADFTLRQDIFDITSALNRLDFELDLGDIGPLAPVVGAERLSASGRVGGTLRTPGGIAQLNFSATLESIQLDTISVREVDFSGLVEGQDMFNFEIDTRIAGLKVGTNTLEDTWFRAFGVLDSTKVEGQYRLNINTQNELSVMTLADFSQRGDTIQVHTTDLQLKVPGKQLNLYRPFTLVYDGRLLESEPLYLRGSTGVELTLGINQTDEQAFRGFVNARDLDLSMFQHMTPDTVNLAGKISGDIEFDVDLAAEKYSGYAEISMQDFFFEGLVIDLANLELRLNDGRLNANLEAIQNEATLAHLDLDVPFVPGNPSDFEDAFFDQPVSGNFALSEIELSTQQPFLTWLGLSGTSGRVSANGKLSGRAGSPEFTGEFEYGDGRLSGVPIDHFNFGWQYHDQDEKLALTARMVSSGQEVAYMYGSVPLKIDWITFNPVDLGEDTTMDLTVKTTSFNLAAVSPFLDQAIARDLQGTVTMDVKLTGDPMSPTVRGDFAMQQGRVLLVENNVVIRDITSTINFQRDRIVLNNLSMQSNGTLRAYGEIQIDGYSPGEIAVSVRADNFRVYDTRDIQAIISMNATVGGRAESPRVTGNLNLVRGFIYLDNFGERTVEEVQLEEDEVSLFDGLKLWNNTAMEFKVGTERNFWVRNRNRPEIQLQLNGELDLVKQRGRELEVFGRMGVNDGFVMQLGKRFTFDQGDLVFSGPPTNPQLQIKTLYALRQPSDIRIWYVISGTVEEPRFSYESDPEMELQDIVSYTVFGRPFNSLMAWEQTITGRTESAVTDAAVDILLDRVEQLATERLGIDLLQIDNTRASGNSGTTIKAGKFISNRLFVAILQELGVNPLSQIIIEYELKKDLDLIITGSDSYHNGVDVRWRYDY